MRIVYFGTGAFGLPTLKSIVESRDFRLAAIVTGPDQPQGRGRKLAPSPIAEWTQAESVGPVLKPTSVRDTDLPETLRHFDADCFLVVAYRILPESVFTIPNVAINLHASLLPRYRGAAPIQRAIMAGETRTGVTTFVLQKSVDTGGILCQRETAIGPDETAGELAERLSILGSETVLETLRGLKAGTLKPKSQDTTQASPAPKITPQDRVLDFSDPPAAIVNRVRGLAPKPTAVAQFRGRLLKLIALRDSGIPTNAPNGEIVNADPKSGVQFAGGGNLLDLIMVQPEGSKPQSGAEFVRGQRISPGDRLERATL